KQHALELLQQQREALDLQLVAMLLLTQCIALLAGRVELGHQQLKQWRLFAHRRNCSAQLVDIRRAGSGLQHGRYFTKCSGKSGPSSLEAERFCAFAKPVSFRLVWVGESVAVGANQCLLAAWKAGPVSDVLRPIRRRATRTGHPPNVSQTGTSHHHSTKAP